MCVDRIRVCAVVFFNLFGTTLTKDKRETKKEYVGKHECKHIMALTILHHSRIV